MAKSVVTVKVALKRNNMSQKRLQAMMDGLTKYINSDKYKGTPEPYKLLDRMGKKLEAIKEGKELKSEFDKFLN